MNQHTIKKTATIRGIGLHTGKEVTMTFQPADAGHGIRFQRMDLSGQPIIRAEVGNVVSTLRGTTIKQDNAHVSTIEHALSALYGLSIDNILIEINGPEVPILDGSAGQFVKMLEGAGLEEQQEERDYLEITEPLSYFDEITGTELVALPADSFQVTTMIDFDSKILGQQYASLNNLEDFAADIAPSRTFVFLHELEYLVDHDLIKGGDLSNAIVLVDRLMGPDDLHRLAKKLNKPSVTIDKEGILNTTDLYFNNEPARHKLLDVMGDLALIGKPIKGKIVATKPGHTANVEFARMLKKLYIEQRRLKGIPKYDPNAEPLFTTADIIKYLPHRFPFLLVDKIVEISDTHVVGIKNVTFNEAFFQGHFPGNPIFPGVLQIEALAQAGGILALSHVGDPGNWDTYFVKIDGMKFKHKVVPGDTLILKMELMEPIRRGLVKMHGSAYVGNKLVSEGELTAQIVRQKESETQALAASSR
ncbi:MAG: bifunctional UDP-3-O-[3-hydroxymyristoyl] N-acetylglucosamine deacetylase/3-hydroxyacyl-ACP dehydratase [Saprospiraceae bacterium]|nr:MAG: bifunctional UDP-3-O-[3-hydroxymyristoyl] N-acetylglucosamine deacetylase/3-hydroxyacyl-ACP dehydratase [Saprospiraceae bacterium]